MASRLSSVTSPIASIAVSASFTQAAVSACCSNTVSYSVCASSSTVRFGSLSRCLSFSASTAASAASICAPLSAVTAPIASIASSACRTLLQAQSVRSSAARIASATVRFMVRFLQCVMAAIRPNFQTYPSISALKKQVFRTGFPLWNFAPDGPRG